MGGHKSGRVHMKKCKEIFCSVLKQVHTELCKNSSLTSFRTYILYGSLFVRAVRTYVGSYKVILNIWIHVCRIS